MIIHSIELENWRGTPHFYCELDSGLNVICGPNEAGKSTLAEALHWALFQDVVGSGRIKSEIEAIIPAFAPLELPTVKVLLVFLNCKALVTKRLSADAPGRECRLVIQRENVPDEHYEQSRAQELLWQLMSNDGVAQNDQNGLAPDGNILFSEQGKSAFYVEQDISAMVRSALSDRPAIDGEGDISLSPRLEKVRTRLQKLRNDQLGTKLKNPVTDGALKKCEAAAWRDQLNELNSNIENQEFLLQTIAQDRRLIAQLEPAITESRARQKVLSETLQSQTVQREAQQNADKLVSEKSLFYNNAATAKDQLQTRVQNIDSQRAIAANSQKKIQTNQPILDAAREKVKALATAMEDAEKHRELCQERNKEKLYAVDAWRSWLEVKEKQTQKNKAQKMYDRLQESERSWKAAKESLPAPDKIIQLTRLSNWRERYRDIETEEKQLHNHLRFDIKLESATTISWRADDDEIQSVDLPAETAFNMHGKSTFDVKLEGIGRIKVSSRADKTIQNDERGIIAKRQNLQREMAKYGCGDLPLPAGFETLEERAQEHSQLQKIADEAKSHWQNTVANFDLADEIKNPDDTKNVLTVAYQHLQEMTQEWENAKEDALPYKGFYPESATAAIAKDALRAATAQRGESEKTIIEAEKDYKQKAKQFHEEKDQAAKLESDLRSETEKIAHAENELRQLCDDDLTDAARKELLKERTDAWILADADLKNVTAARVKLGEAISGEYLQQQQSLLQKLQSDIANMEKELSACRAKLQLQTQQDPENALEEMLFQRDELTTKLAKEETRLRGLLLLQTVLEAQRLRFGDSIAEPLNARLSPWLSTLRGKSTSVEFDASGKRLIGVQTKDAHGHYRLNFEAHSGGMQEQAALLIRLIYLQMTSSRLPSGKLPVILDDPLTQTDNIRRAGLIKVLLEAAQSLQILYISCHEEHLAGMTEGRRISLPGSAGE
jgi:DNA repair exonuclease SbcCD ATPase subunit